MDILRIYYQQGYRDGVFRGILVTIAFFAVIALIRYYFTGA